MHKQNYFSTGMVDLVLISSLCFALIACSGNQQSTEGNDPSANTVSAPDLDIHAAAFLGDVKAIRQHIEAGTDLNAKDTLGGSTPLITATVFDKRDVAQALIKAGADLNIQNNEGSTALHTAAFFCRLEIVRMLLENGADRDKENNYGSTALQSVAGPFEEVKPIYDLFSKELGPLGLKLDYSYLEETRPRIAQMLKSN